jgi:chaperonin cofactor prefoldin
VSKLNNAKILLEIGKIAAEIYGIIVDKAIDKADDSKEKRIQQLERDKADLEARLKKLEGASVA